MVNVGRFRVHHLCESSREAYRQRLATTQSEDSDDSAMVNWAERRREEAYSSYDSDASEYIPGMYRAPECSCVPMYREKKRTWVWCFITWVIWAFTCRQIDWRAPELELDHKSWCPCFAVPVLDVTWGELIRDAYNGFYPTSDE